MTQAMLLLIPISMLFVAAATATVVWAVRSGQFEDLDAEARRILLDDPEAPRAPVDGRAPGATQDHADETEGPGADDRGEQDGAGARRAEERR